MHVDIITRSAAKSILAAVSNGDARPIDLIIAESAKLVLPVGDYENLADEVMKANGRVVEDIQKKGKVGKVQFLVGQMMRHRGKGRDGAGRIEVQPKLAEEVLMRKMGISI